MTSPWYRILSRSVGLVACAIVVVIAAQWLSLSFGWDPLIDIGTVRDVTDDFTRTLREGPTMLAAIGVIVVGVVLLVAWLLAGRRSPDDGTFRVGARGRRLRIDRSSLAASLERRLEPLDRRVDVDVSVSRRGRVDLRLVTPDTSATGTVAEHTDKLRDIVDERNLPCRLGSVDVVDVRRLKSRHRVR